MKRIRPCEFCKQRRRKCELPDGSSSCTRCSRMNLTCVFDTTTPTNMRYNTSSRRATTTNSTATKASTATTQIPDWNMTEVYDGDDLQALCEHVKTMELELHQLQQKLAQQRQQPTSLLLESSTTTTTMIAESEVESLTIPKEWNLTFVNGHLRLETGINTLSDLLRYRLTEATISTPISYLSPIGSSTAVRFTLEHDSMLSKAVLLLRKHGIFNGNGNSFNIGNNDYHVHSPRGHYHQSLMGHPQSPTISPLSPLSPSCKRLDPLSSSLLSTITTDCPETLVDPLVQQYFVCYNPTMPLVHEATFMTQYTKQPGMADPTPSGSTYYSYYNTSPSPSSTTSSYSNCTSPTSSFTWSSSSSSTDNNGLISQHNPLTLAICCFMSVSYCAHISFTSHQKREYGEYFYAACREQINDHFDDPSPHRQLEVLMSINFLYKFMLLTLRMKDARKLAALGYMISTELIRLAALPNTTLSSTEKELTSRHGILACMTFTGMEYICDKRMIDILPKKVQLIALPDESDMTVSVLELYKHFFDLVLNHDCVVIMEQLRRVVIGEVGQVTLEAMVRFEQTCLDWWAKLPKKWRYCEQPYDTSAKRTIEQCDYSESLMVHSFLLAMTLGVHSTLLQPQNSHDQFLDIIHKRAMEMTLNCCELLMVVSDRLKVVSTYCGYSCDYGVRVCDCLQKLFWQSQRERNTTNMTRIMKFIDRCFNDLDSAILSDHHVPSEMSLISSTSSVSSTSSHNDGGGPVVYTKYPLPAHALLYDIINSSVKNIGLDSSGISSS
ncbi:hypothetical protein BC941DRAFT_407468 [Chlamydoabsidia padenii]|nr:hypothetical protein BC941DRAFT_407468 [Chlamydoabsidia padenii]